MFDRSRRRGRPAGRSGARIRGRWRASRRGIRGQARSHGRRGGWGGWCCIRGQARSHGRRGRCGSRRRNGRRRRHLRSSRSRCSDSPRGSGLARERALPCALPYNHLPRTPRGPRLHPRPTKRRGLFGPERMQAQQRHREAGVFVRRQRQLVPTMDRDLVGELQELRVEALDVTEDARALHLVADRLRRVLCERDPMHQRRQRLQRGIEGQAARLHAVGHRKQRRHIARGERVEHRIQMVVAHRTQHVGDLLLLDLARAVCDRLVEQRQRVAHRARRRLRQMTQRARLEGHAFGLQDLRQVIDDVPLRHLLEVELQAARQHRHRNLLRVGGGEDEFHMLRRLLERLQHRVERMPGEHVDFVDHEHLEAPLHRRIRRLVEQCRHVLDTAVRGCVHLDVIGKAVGIDRAAGAALVAGLGRDAGLAVERLSEDAADRGLAHAAGAGKQPGVMQPPGGERVRQRTHDVLLTDQRAEGLRPPLACEDLIAHGGRF